MRMQRAHSIKIEGTGGQGIKFLSVILGKILVAQKLHVSVNFEYDAAMRGGGIEASVIFSQDPIECPLRTTFEYLLTMLDSKENQSDTETEIADKIIYAPNNMIALGKLLNALGIELESINLIDFLPTKYQEQNIININKGYSSYES